MVKKPVVNIISAGDRYNYGDVLYAVIMREYLKKYEPCIYDNYEIEHYGVIASDLTAVGGIKTLPISDLYKKDFAGNSLTVVAGGQVVGANIEVLFKFLKSGKFSLYADLIRYFALSKLGKNRGEALVKRFDCKTKYPYIISRKDMKTGCKIAYSNVGGYIPGSEVFAIEEIKKADYVSVRDALSYEENKKYCDSVYLAPDAAILMSDLFPRTRLYDEVSEKVKSIDGKYIAIQFSLSYYRQHEDEIVKTLSDFSAENKDVKIVLVPIGYAILHDDLVALRKLRKNIPEAVLIENLTIKEIMYLISGAEFFAGTSLHGIVTAMSFAVPYIALGAHNSSAKLDCFVGTWGCKAYSKTMPVTELPILYKCREENLEQLKASANNQIDLAKKNYEKVFGLIK